MKTLALALVALAGVATAAPNYPGMPQTRGRGSAGSAAYGDVTTNPTYATQAAVNLYVDPTGSDSNPCTSTGTAACLTLQGAESKIPKLVRHPVTVTVAAGSYTGVGIYGHTFEPLTSSGAYIVYTGAAALTNFTPATGSATGTATAGSAGTNAAPTFGTLTDAAATWTTNDLRGKLIEITGGTGSGQIKAIAANTGTVITIAGTWTAPDATSTYAIRTTGANITTAINQSAFAGVAAGGAAGIIVQGNRSTRYTTTGGAPITLVGLGVAVTTSIGMRIQESAVQVTNCIISNSTGVGLNVAAGGFILLSQSSVTQSGSAPAVSFSANPGGSAGGGTLVGLVAVSAAGAGAFVVGMSGSAIQIRDSELVATSNAAVQVVYITGSAGAPPPTNGYINQSRITCTSGGSTIGVGTSAQSAASAFGIPTVTLNSITMTNCPVGVGLDAPAVVSLGALNSGTQVTFTGPGSGTALKAYRGGRIAITAATINIATYTNETDIDGTTQTLATITGATPPALMNAYYGSFIGR